MGGGGSGAWKQPERSGGCFQAALRKFGGGVVGEGGVGAGEIIVPAVSFAQHFCFQQAGEALTIEELVPEPAVEAFAVGILPWAAGFDIEGFKPPPPDPVLHGPGDKFRAIV